MMLHSEFCAVCLILHYLWFLSDDRGKIINFLLINIHYRKVAHKWKLPGLMLGDVVLI